MLTAGLIRCWPAWLHVLIGPLERCLVFTLMNDRGLCLVPWLMRCIWRLLHYRYRHPHRLGLGSKIYLSLSSHWGGTPPITPRRPFTRMAPTRHERSSIYFFTYSHLSLGCGWDPHHLSLSSLLDGFLYGYDSITLLLV